MATERVLQQKVLQLFKQHSILAVKTDSTSTRGWPDLTAIFPTGETVFVELKTKTGRLSESQKAIHSRIQQQGAIVYVVRTIEEAQTLIATHTRST
jgi:hypothetical protein